MIDATFKDHAVWSVLDAVEGSVERDAPNEFSASLAKLYQYFRWILENSDPAYIVPEELDALTKELQNSAAGIPNDDITNQIFLQALQHLTPSLAKFPYPRIKRIFRSEVNEIVNQIEADSSRLQEMVGRLRGEIEVIRSEVIQTRVISTDVTADMAATQAQIKSMVSDFESQNVAAISAAIAEMRTDYTNEKNSRSERFQEEVNIRKDQLAEMKLAAETISKRTDAELEVVRKEQTAKLADFQALAQSKYTEIDKLFQDAGQTVLAGGFAQAALGESTRYESDSRYAKCSLVLAAIALAGLAGTDLWRGTFTWLDALYKLPISVVLAAPGLYFAGLASKHRQEANRLRSLGLRIGAFDAFVKSSNSEDAIELRNSIAPHFFSEDGKRSADDSGDLVSEKFLDAIGKVADKLPKIGK